MAIEAARAVILDSPMDVAMLAGCRFPGRERDETEVRNYYRALQEIERLAARQSGEFITPSSDRFRRA